jgi:hypothetical protein
MAGFFSGRDGYDAVAAVAATAGVAVALVVAVVRASTISQGARRASSRVTSAKA